MTAFWSVLALAIVGSVGLSFAWRAASRRWALPCPAALSWTFEGGLADRIAGTERTLERMRLEPGQSILEIGPGPGRLLIPASQRILPGGQGLGIDVQAKMIERLTARAQAAGVNNLTAQVGDATTLVLPACSFDLVFMCTVLGEVPDRTAAIAECARVLKSGGTLAITEIIGDPHYQSRSKVRQLAEAAGLTWLSEEGNWRMYTARFRKP
jgi:ubiquinone/menaquinone biosynthesis C-methylase UbiE